MARVLLIDDNRQIRDWFRIILEEEGYEVDEAGDGNEGIRQYKEKPADIVITDILMPEKDGLETIMELWRDNPDVKIIAISGGARTLDADMCLRHARIFGAMRSFSKPVRRDELITAVAELLQPA